MISLCVYCIVLGWAGNCLQVGIAVAIDFRNLVTYFFFACFERGCSNSFFVGSVVGAILALSLPALGVAGCKRLNLEVG